MINRIFDPNYEARQKSYKALKETIDRLNAKDKGNDNLNLNDNKNQQKPQSTDDFVLKHLDLKIYNCNTRSLSNKKQSISDILVNQQIDIAIFSEINCKNVPKFKDYLSFNLVSKRKFHGISLLVHKSLASKMIRIPQPSEDFEVVHLQLRDSIIPLNIFGVYIDVEARSNIDTIKQVHGRLTNMFQSHLDKGEAIVSLGDWNRNPFVSKPSAGTKLLMEWLSDDNMVLLNDDTPTRIDPATGNGTVLDLGIISKNIHPWVNKFYVDTEREFTPFSVVKKNNTLEKRYSDHKAVVLELKILMKESKPSKSYPVINFHNKSGWSKYAEISDKHAEKMINIINDNDNVDAIQRKLGIVDMEIQVESFGITWRNDSKKKHKKRNNRELKELFEEKYDEIDKALDVGIKGKDLNSKIYNIKAHIKGKNTNSEPQAINDPSTGELITNPNQIKQVSLDHNLKILTKNTPRQEDLEEINNKKIAHEEIMSKNDTDSWQLDWETYLKVCTKIKQKNKNMYKTFNKAGDKYKFALFLYMKKLIALEQIPSTFWLTTLIQIWKKKGSALDLNNMRFIHMRMWHCKLLEALITEKMKNNIVSNTPKIQLGGMPGSSSVEHLVVLKTWMKLKEETKQAGIFQTFDMSKFFDKESLMDCMYTLNKVAKIDNKSYRIWYLINSKTRISVKTSVGMSEYHEIEDSIGQGQDGAALVSALNLGADIFEIFKDIPSTHIGFVPLNSVIFQDDIGKMSDKIEDARSGAELIDNTLKRKLLSSNYDKSDYLIFGTTRQKNAMKKKLDKNPIKMGGENLKYVDALKYLGDIINSKGCEQSIMDTIKERKRKLISKCEEIIEIAEHPLMGGLRSSTPAFKLFEATIIPALLHNCESWIGINDKHIKELQDLQDNFIRKVLRLHSSTPKALLQWDIGLMPMKWRINLKKLTFTRKVMHDKNHTSIVKQVMYNEQFQDIKGLGHECQSICEEIDLDNVLTNNLNVSEIKSKIWEKVRTEARVNMLASVKVADRVTANGEDNSYIHCLTLPESRIWIRYRARCISGVKVNFKQSHRDLKCRFCSSGSNESQEHLEKCAGTAFERRGLRRLESGFWRDVLLFWRRMSVKLTVKQKAAVT